MKSKLVFILAVLMITCASFFVLPWMIWMVLTGRHGEIYK